MCHIFFVFLFFQIISHAFRCRDSFFWQPSCNFCQPTCFSSRRIGDCPCGNCVHRNNTSAFVQVHAKNRKTLRHPARWKQKAGLSLACANIRKGGRRDKRKQAFFLACSEHTGIRRPVLARNHPLRKAHIFFRPSGTKKCYFCVTKYSSPRF